MTSPMNTVSTPPSTKWVVRLRSNSHKTNTFRTALVRTTDQMIAGMLVPAAWRHRQVGACLKLLGCAVRLVMRPLHLAAPPRPMALDLHPQRDAQEGADENNEPKDREVL